MRTIIRIKQIIQKQLLVQKYLSSKTVNDIQKKSNIQNHKSLDRINRDKNTTTTS